MPGAFCWGCLDIQGDEWLPLLVDAAGHAQVDVKSVEGTVTIAGVFYKVAFEFSGGLLLYRGFALAGTDGNAVGWAIEKWTWSGSDPEKSEFADGVSTLTKVWDDRAGYAYSS